MPRLVILFAFYITTAVFSDGQTFTTIYNFGSQSGFSDGADPTSALVQGSDGNLYGTTSQGGDHGYGTVFKINIQGLLARLYSFCSPQDCNDGAQPRAGLVQGTDGNFYGTTINGGANNYGTVFKITPQGTLTTLHNFNFTDGGAPYAGLVQATDGNLYGTTVDGPNVAGTVFKVSTTGTFTNLHNFNSTDGSYPMAALFQFQDGNLYGTTSRGATNDRGTVFSITPGGTLTTLHIFDSSDGGDAEGAFIQGSDGNLWSTTRVGGVNNSGTVFKMTPLGTVTTVYGLCSLQWCADGLAPFAGLVQASDGNYYGTTQLGGINNDGIVFKITPGGTLTTLHTFDGQDGAWPLSGLMQAVDGNLYGTTSGGGQSGAGTIFRLDVGLGFALTVSKMGDGTVTSNDSYINCGAVCSQTYLKGKVVMLTATPDSGWKFTGWDGCDNVNANICTVVMNSSRNVTATFKALYLVSVGKTGNGTVVSGDGHIYCGNVCSYSYIDGTLVGLSAIPAPGYSFSGWTGCDQVQGEICLVQMSGVRSVTATFTSANVTLTSLSFKPSYVKGGQLSAGTLTLSAPAPPAGVTVGLSSDHPSVAHPPSFVIVPGGKTSIVFGVNTFPVKSNTTVMITATAGSSQVSGTLTVGTTSLPPSLK